MVLMLQLFKRRPIQCKNRISPYELGERLWELHQHTEMTQGQKIEDMRLTAETHNVDYKDVRFGYMSRNLQDGYDYLFGNAA